MYRDLTIYSSSSPDPQKNRHIRFSQNQDDNDDDPYSRFSSSSKILIPKFQQNNIRNHEENLRNHEEKLQSLQSSSSSFSSNVSKVEKPNNRLWSKKIEERSRTQYKIDTTQHPTNNRQTSNNTKPPADKETLQSLSRLSVNRRKKVFNQWRIPDCAPTFEQCPRLGRQSTCANNKVEKNEIAPYHQSPRSYGEFSSFRNLNNQNHTSSGLSDKTSSIQLQPKVSAWSYWKKMQGIQN